MAAPTGLDLAPGAPPLTIAEVADHYRMTERQLRKVIRDKAVEVLRYGHTVRFDRRALISLEEALRVKPTMMPAPSPPPPSSARSRESAYEKALRLTTLASRSRKTRAKQQPVNGEDK